jgi:hypothetical protein
MLGKVKSSSFFSKSSNIFLLYGTRKERGVDDSMYPSSSIASKFESCSITCLLTRDLPEKEEEDEDEEVEEEENE